MKKRIVSILLVSLLSVSMVACGTEKKTEEPNQEQKTEDIKSDDELSQSEWVEKYGDDLMEDGYEKVDLINIDSGDTKLEYVSNEKFTTESGEELLLVNFNFSNVSAGSTTVDAQYNFSAFQDGIEITVYSWLNDEIEGDVNRGKEILDGASINISVGIAPDNWDRPIKLRVDDNMAYDEIDTAHNFQQQEIVIK